MTRKKQADNLLNSYHLLSFAEIDSTNEEAKRLAHAGGGHGAVIWAKKQSAGKGRMGRIWVSQEGNLFVSVLLKPQKPLIEFSQLSFVAANAALEALRPLMPKGARLACKWPNDILLGGKKLGGILLESFQAGDMGSWVVVGLGLNIENCPAKMEFPATCLKDEGVELVSAKIVLSRFIHHFIEEYNLWSNRGFAPIRKRWTEAAWGKGKKLRARMPDNEIEGVFDGIDAHGALILKLGGKKQKILAADVFPAEAMRA